MVRRKNQTIFLDVTEETTIGNLKTTLEDILKKGPDDQQLYKIDTNETLDDNRTLGDCGYKASNSKAQDPSTIGLRFKIGKLQHALSISFILQLMYHFLLIRWRI